MPFNGADDTSCFWNLSGVGPCLDRRCFTENICRPASCLLDITGVDAFKFHRRKVLSKISDRSYRIAESKQVNKDYLTR